MWPRCLMESEYVQVGWLSASDAPSLDAATELLACEIGRFSREKLAQLASGGASRVAIGRMGPEGRIVGVGAGELRRNDIRKLEVFGRDAIADLRGRALGILSSFAVDSELRKRGIGRTLANALIGWLRGEGCQVLVATSWDWGGPNPSLPGLEGIGFATRARVDGETYRRTNLGGESC